MTGRFNFGVITLNLVMIYQKSKVNGTNFYDELDYYLDLTKKHHIKTYKMLSKKKASCNPLLFMEGGLYGGNLNPNDTIELVMKHGTCSIGYTGLNELNLLHNGKTILEDGEFPLEVLKYINSQSEKFKKETGILFGVYGTPGESLVGLQVKQFKNMFGEVPEVTSKEYLTNSFHCFVGEDISPIVKQDSEARFWPYTAGGRIQYVRYDLSYNTEAIKTVVRRAMKMGFYEGVNLSLSYCEECGHQSLEKEQCPKCKSTNVTCVSRNCGYLSYDKVKGRTMVNDTKLAEIKDRKSM